jgi:HEAT repeat protein
MFRPLFLALLLSALPLAAAEPAPALAGLTYSGDQSALDALDRELTAAGTDAGRLAALETRLLALLRRTDTTFAARQAICQRLGLVLAAAPAKTDASALKPLATMLADERDSDLARLALERAPGAVPDTLLLQALARTSGRTRLGIIDSLGRRHTASAVPALAKLLAASDAATATAAACALGAIGTPEADAALRAARSPDARTLALARLEATVRLPAADAARALRELQDNPGLPANVRAAAFRRGLDVDASGADARLVAALGGGDWTFKQVALEALANAPASGRIQAVVTKLATFDAPTQIGALAALARAGAAAAVPAAIAATRHSAADVRLEAVNALGFLPGSAEVVGLLVQLGTGDDALAKAARISLSRLNGPGVSAAILAAAERGEAARRVICLEQLALRHLTEGLPLLRRSRSEPDAAVRAAAVGALGELAPFSDQQAALDWAVAATDDTEQSRALRAVVNITLRHRDEAVRGRAVYAAIEKASPAVALRLLPALGRLGGAASAECAARLAVRADDKVARAATDALSRWTDASALPSLATVAEKAALPAVRVSAVDAALRQLERQRAAWSPATTALLGRLLAAAPAGEQRKQALAIVARATDQAALALAEKWAGDAALASEARYAIGAIKAALAGAPKLQASANAGVSNLTDGKTSTRWSTPLAGEEWIAIDFRVSRPLRRLTLDQTGRAGEYPEKYAVHVSDDAANPGPAIVTGQGQRNRTVIELPANTRGRHVWIKNIAERKDTPWAVCELYVD